MFGSVILIVSLKMIDNIVYGDQKEANLPKLDLNKNYFLIAVVDDVVLYAHQSGVRDTCS